jgi:hypothetical protein
MSRDPFPPVVLEERFRQFVLSNMSVDQISELSEDQGGALIYVFQDQLMRGLPDIPIEGTRTMSPELLDVERTVFYDLVWIYVQAGIFRLTSGRHSRRAWSGVYLTAEGRRMLEGGAPIPEDVEAYLRRLSEDAPQLDETALFYVKEALLAFRARLYPSTVVMLGCAEEHLVLQMARALLPRLPAGAQTPLRQALDRGPISKVWAAFRPRFEPYRTTIFAGEALTSEAALDGLFLAVKTARDDGGHPQPVRTTEGAARALLQSFHEHAKAASKALADIPGI